MSKLKLRPLDQESCGDADKSPKFRITYGERTIGEVRRPFVEARKPSIESYKPLCLNNPHTPKTQTPQTQTPRTQTPRTQTPRTQTPQTQTLQTQTLQTQTPQSHTPRSHTPQSHTPRIRLARSVTGNENGDNHVLSPSPLPSALHTPAHTHLGLNQIQHRSQISNNQVAGNSQNTYSKPCHRTKPLGPVQIGVTRPLNPMDGPSNPQISPLGLASPLASPLNPQASPLTPSALESPSSPLTDFPFTPQNIPNDDSDSQVSFIDTNASGSLTSVESISTPLLRFKLGPRSSVDTSESLGSFEMKHARADRKIQDLEISNSSLMSVNQYLEKRLGQQGLQIQYLKDLAKESSLPVDIFRESEESDSEEDERKDENYDALHTLNRESTILTLEEKTSLIERRMKSHIDYLERSERVNKSIRKCVFMSETLLKDANESLQLSIRPDEVKIGGRVALEEEE